MKRWKLVLPLAIKVEVNVSSLATSADTGDQNVNCLMAVLPPVIKVNANVL